MTLFSWFDTANSTDSTGNVSLPAWAGGCPDPLLIPPDCTSFGEKLGAGFEIYRCVMLGSGALVCLVSILQLWRIFNAGGTVSALHDTTTGLSIQFSLHLRVFFWSLVFVLRMVDPTGLYLIYPTLFSRLLDYIGIALVFGTLAAIAYTWHETLMHTSFDRDSILRFRKMHITLQIFMFVLIATAPFLELFSFDRWLLLGVSFAILAVFAIVCELAVTYCSWKFYQMLRQEQNMKSRAARVFRWFVGNTIMGFLTVVYLCIRATSVLFQGEQDVARTFLEPSFQSSGGMYAYLLAFGVLHILELIFILQILLFYRRVRSSSPPSSPSLRKSSFASTALLCSPAPSRFDTVHRCEDFASPLIGHRSFDV